MLVKFRTEPEVQEINVTIWEASKERVYDATIEQMAEFLERRPYKGHAVVDGILYADMSMPHSKSVAFFSYDA